MVLSRHHSFSNEAQGSHIGPLDLSQIHRLLRPLRNKIKSLSETLNKGIANPREPLSYATQHGGHRSHLGIHRKGKRTRSNSFFATYDPLILIPHSSRLQRASTGNIFVYGVPLLDLSKRVYAVADSFRHLVSKAYGVEYLRRESTMRSLMEITASIIGSDIEASSRELLEGTSSSDDSREGSNYGNTSEEEDDETSVIDGCYEQLPEHLRCWAIVPHAISMITDSIPVDIPSLWELCLDVTVDHAACHDSLKFLKRLLLYALSPAVGSLHPLNGEHAMYLVNLLRKPNNPSRPLTQCWNNALFMDQVLNALSKLESGRAETVWTAAGIHKLWEALRSDAQLMMGMVQGLARVKISTQKGSERISCWVRDLLTRSICHELEQDAKLPDDWAEQLLGLAESIMQQANAFEDSADNIRNAAQFQHTFISLSISLVTHSLNYNHLTHPHRHIAEKIVHSCILPHATPIFSPLLFACTYPSHLTNTPSYESPLQLDIVLSHATALKLHGFSQLEEPLLREALAVTEQAGNSSAVEQDVINTMISVLEDALIATYVTPRKPSPNSRYSLATKARTGHDTFLNVDPENTPGRSIRSKTTTTWSKKIRIESESPSPEASPLQSIPLRDSPTNTPSLRRKPSTNSSPYTKVRRPPRFARNGEQSPSSSKTYHPSRSPSTPTGRRKMKGGTAALAGPSKRKANISPSPQKTTKPNTNRRATFTGYPVRKKPRKDDRDELDLFATSEASSPMMSMHESSCDELLL